MNNQFRTLTVSEAADLVAGKRCLIICHVNPDGDALGSATALLEAIRLTGGDGKVVTPSPVPHRLRFIIGDMDTAYVPGEEDSFDLTVTVDTASVSQLGDLSHLAPKVALSVDHHETCTPYSPYLLYPGEAAAAVPVYDIFEEFLKRGFGEGNKAPVLRRIFCAVASDTGSFKFSNSSAKAFTVAAEIAREMESAVPVETGCPIDKMTLSDISAALFESVTEKDLAIRKMALENLRYIAGGRIAISYATVEDRQRIGAKMEDLGGMVDSVRSIEGTDVAVVIRQTDADLCTFRGSARGNTDVDVATPAALLGGGGHRRAAGFTLHADSVEEAIAVVEKVFGEALPKSPEEK